MLLVAGYEVMARQHRGFTGIWGIGIGTLSMFISSFSVTLLALTVIIGVEPWYSVQYLIPLLGMQLGNTMSGIAVSLDRLTQTGLGAAQSDRGTADAWPLLAGVRSERSAVTPCAPA